MSCVRKKATNRTQKALLNGNLLLWNRTSPDELPPQNLDHKRLIGPVGKANTKLAEYNGLMQCIVNPAIMLSPLDTQEAISSSKIEEILNYREAIFFGEKRVAEGSIELELVLELHKILMSSVRGEGKSPGQWRKKSKLDRPLWMHDRKCQICSPRQAQCPIRGKRLEWMDQFLPTCGD